MIALNHFFEKGLPGSRSYEAYRVHIEELLAEGKTTGTNFSELYVNFTKMNLQRMKRIKKTYSPSADITALVKQCTAQTWLILTEAWCGDAAQSVPMMANLAELNDQIELKLILRDEHPEIMNNYLTDGGKGIPKLIALSPEGAEYFNWGPRPAPAQQMVRDYKAMEEPKPDYLTFAETVQRWYAADGGQTFERELKHCLSTLFTEQDL